MDSLPRRVVRLVRKPNRHRRLPWTPTTGTSYTPHTGHPSLSDTLAARRLFHLRRLRRDSHGRRTKDCRGDKNRPCHYTGRLSDVKDWKWRRSSSFLLPAYLVTLPETPTKNDTFHLTTQEGKGGRTVVTPLGSGTKVRWYRDFRKAFTYTPGRRVLVQERVLYG